MEKSKEQYWLVKFAPFRTSWTDIVKAGTFTLRGVRNKQARNYLAEMTEGDFVLFYHSQRELQVVGLMRVEKKAFPDPTSADSKWLTATFQAIRTLSNPVPLSTIKSTVALSKIRLISQPRLSVMPLEKHEFEIIITLSNRE